MPLTNGAGRIGPAVQSVYGDSSSSIHIVNKSSLKRLPAVIRDLSKALSTSTFNQQQVLNNGFDIYLQDIASKSFDTSASVAFQPGDTVYHLKLNTFNKRASDRALAATLIHEIMHCILLAIYDRARRGDQKALSSIATFSQKLKNSYGSSFNVFFDLMNRGGEGPHELMYQLFYPDMSRLLQQFARIHKPAFLHVEEADFLMWSGLQKITAYQRLSYDEKVQIESTILTEKGIPVSFISY